MSLCTVNYGKESISFSVLHVARKTLAIEVYPDRSVVVKAPLETELSEIRKRVGRRARWIIRQQNYFRQFEPRTPRRHYVGGETHLYLGKQFRLKISGGDRDAVKLTRGYLHVEVQGPPGQETIKGLLDRWYSQKAAAQFRESFDRCWPHFEKRGLARPRMQIRRMRKRWGSLSRNGLLTLNTDLIRAPKECLDYVIIHELCHIPHHNHGAEFYRLLEEVMPDWDKRKHKLELLLV